MVAWLTLAFATMSAVEIAHIFLCRLCVLLSMPADEADSGRLENGRRGRPVRRAVHAADSIERFFVYAPTSEQPAGALFSNTSQSTTTIDG